MMVFLGVRAAYGRAEDPVTGDPIPTAEREVLDGNRRVEVGPFPAGTSLGEAFTDVTNPAAGVWVSQSPDPAPAWVSSDSANLAALIGEHYGCEVREYLPAGERGEFANRLDRFAAPAAVESLEG